MENGGRPAAGAHWLAETAPNFRARVVDKITKNLSRIPQGQQVDDPRLHHCASRFEARVFSQSDSAEDYLRIIGTKMVFLQRKCQPAVQAAASELQQQAQMGRHQMRPVDAVVANSSAAPAFPPPPVRPSQLQNMHLMVNQAQQAILPPVAPPVVQLHPCHQAVVSQIQAPHSTQQQQPRMNQQDLRVDQRQGYQAHNGQHANVAIRQCGGQNPHPAAGEVDWREEVFQKITSLKDAHFSELVEFGRVLEAIVRQLKANGQLESLPVEKANQYIYVMGRIKTVLNFLEVQKTNIDEDTKDTLDKWQTSINSLLMSYRKMRAQTAAKNARRQSQNCHEPPQVGGATATDDNQQNHHEQHAAEASTHSSQNDPSGTPLSQQQNHEENLAGEAEDNFVCGEAESTAAVNLPGDTAPSTGRTCSQEIQQSHQGDEVIPQLTQTTVEHVATSPAQLEAEDDSVRVEAEDDSVQAEAERPVGMEVNTVRSFSPGAIHSLASDMGVNLKRAFHRMTSDTMDGSNRMWFDGESSRKSCHKKQKTYGSALDEIRDTFNMLVETEIKIHEDDTGGAEGTVIELCYNAVSLAPNLKAVVCASEISTKLFVHADYPRSSPVILGGDGEGKKGVPWVVDMAFRRALGLLPEPRSIEGMAKAWDSVVRRAVVQFAHRLGGGTFSSRYGHWESCIPAV